MDNNFNNDFSVKTEETQKTEGGVFSQTTQTSWQTQYEQTAAFTPAPNYVPCQVENEEPVSLGDWIGSLLLFNLVPCVGLIICIVWAFSKDTKTSKRNFCRAYLIITAVSIVLMAVLYAILFGMLVANGVMDAMMYM